MLLHRFLLSANHHLLVILRYRARLQFVDKQIQMLQRSIYQAQSASDRKFRAIKQPTGWDNTGYTNTEYASGAPMIPPPNCAFDPEKVNYIQQLFTQLGGEDAVMTPSEWENCMHAAGVFNKAVARRLFAMFDTSGDHKMNAKEFAWGLSDICNEAEHPGSSMSGYTQPKTPEEVRRAFAYRFYDTDTSGFLDKHDFGNFLLSFKSSCDDAVSRAGATLLEIYGLGDGFLAITTEQDWTEEKNRLSNIADDITSELTRFNEQIFVRHACDGYLECYCACLITVLTQHFFTEAPGKKMDYGHFTKFSKQAPICVDWLTELGKKLERQFRPGSHLVGMNFEEVQLKLDVNATEISHHRIQTAYRQCAGDKIMTVGSFAKCMRKLGVNNRIFSDRLFRLADANCNSTLSEDEFVHWASKLITSTPDERCQLAFQIIDVHKHGYLDRKAVHKYFQSWFTNTLSEVDQMIRLLDEWINGRVPQIDASQRQRSSKRVGGLTADKFIGSERVKNLDIAVNIQKKCAGEVGILTEQLTVLAFQYAKESNPSQGVHLYAPEFCSFITEKTRFVSWMGSLCQSWMVTPEQHLMEAQCTSKVGPSPRLPIRHVSKITRGSPAVEPLSSVIDVGDIGKTLGSVLHTARTGELDLVMWAADAKPSTGPGSTWWRRAFSSRVNPRLACYRPKTCFDSISAVDVHRSFLPQIRERMTYNRANFRQQLRTELGLQDTHVVDFLYDAFDVNGDGMLEAEEATIGILLLAQGETVEHRRLSFNCFDVANRGVIARHDMHTWLKSFFRIGMAALRGWLVRLTELFGEPAKTPPEQHDATEFTSAVLQMSQRRLETIIARMVAVAFAADVDNDGVISREEFELFATENPQFVKWSKYLAVVCLQVIHTVENQQRSGTAHDRQRGQLPSPSMLRIRIRFPTGTSWDRLRVHHVRDMFASFSVYGKLGPEEFAGLMRQLHIVSPYTVRRLFTLFDRDGGGDVTMRELGAGFFLLCGGGLREKLTAAFQLFDEHNKGTTTMLWQCKQLLLP
jgi:Ca2+-binding EF-hand superfamily protein